MPSFGSSSCDFNVAETQDGKNLVISVKLGAGLETFDQGRLTFELNPSFELGDATTLTRMLKDLITQVHFEPMALDTDSAGTSG